MKRAVLFLVCTLTASPAFAQAGDFLNPFLTAQDYRTLRGATEDAIVSLRYEGRRELAGTPEPVADLVIELGPDWALVTQGARTSILDFRLLRRFDLLADGSGFISLNLNSGVTLRVLQQQNRIMINELSRIAGTSELGDACDASTELGVSLPGNATDGNIAIERQERSAAVTCDGRLVGSVESSEDAAPPATLWPVIARTMTVHPTVLAEAKAFAAAPQFLETSYRRVGGVRTQSWRLASVTPSTRPYALSETLSNATEQWLAERVGVRTARLAAETSGGTAAGGIPRFEDWDAKLRDLADEGNGAGAALAVVPILSMFPEIVDRCPSDDGDVFACSVVTNLKAHAEQDAAVAAFLAVAAAEQNGQASAILDAMDAARASEQADHPALNTAYGLALLRFGSDFGEQAAARNLPVDALALIESGIAAYPYNGAYWTDLGDVFAGRWDLDTSLLLYDVAMSVPLPEMQRKHDVLLAKRDVIGRIRRDFPEFYLQE